MCLYSKSLVLIKLGDPADGCGWSLNGAALTAKASWRAGPVGEPLFEHFRSLHHQLYHKRSIFYSI